MWTADEIARLCYEHYRTRLPKQGKPEPSREWTLLAAVVKIQPAAEQACDSANKPVQGETFPPLNGPSPCQRRQNCSRPCRDSPGWVSCSGANAPLRSTRCRGPSHGGRWLCWNHSPRLGQPARMLWRNVQTRNLSMGPVHIMRAHFMIRSFPLSDKGSCLDGNRNEMHRPVQNEEER